MKKVIFVIVAGVMSLCAMQVKAQTEATPKVSQEQTDEKIKIKVEELPDAIKSSLSGDSYKGWSAQTAYYIKKKDIYEVDVKKGTETKTLRFTKDGNIVE